MMWKVEEIIETPKGYWKVAKKKGFTYLLNERGEVAKLLKEGTKIETIETPSYTLILIKSKDPKERERGYWINKERIIFVEGERIDTKKGYLILKEGKKNQIYKLENLTPELEIIEEGNIKDIEKGIIVLETPKGNILIKDKRIILKTKNPVGINGNLIEEKEGERIVVKEYKERKIRKVAEGYKKQEKEGWIVLKTEKGDVAINKKTGEKIKGEEIRIEEGIIIVKKKGKDNIEKEDLYTIGGQKIISNVKKLKGFYKEGKGIIEIEKKGKGDKKKRILIDEKGKKILNIGEREIEWKGRGEKEIYLIEKKEDKEKRGKITYLIKGELEEEKWKVRRKKLGKVEIKEEKSFIENPEKYEALIVRGEKGEYLINKEGKRISRNYTEMEKLGEKWIIGIKERHPKEEKEEIRVEILTEKGKRKEKTPYVKKLLKKVNVEDEVLLITKKEGVIESRYYDLRETKKVRVKDIWDLIGAGILIRLKGDKVELRKNEKKVSLGKNEKIERIYILKEGEIIVKENGKIYRIKENKEKNLKKEKIEGELIEKKGKIYLINREGGIEEREIDMEKTERARKFIEAVKEMESRGEECIYQT